MKNLFFFVLTAVIGMFTQGGWATPIITSVVETGGDNEATDTITAQWTGVTFATTQAGEPIVGSVVGTPFTVGTFGHATPTFVDRAHRYFSDPSVAGSVPIPSYLLGGEIIMSGNDNRDNASYKLDVTISRPAVVYMLIDNRLSDTVNTDGPTFDAAHMQWILDQGWTAVRTGSNRDNDSGRPDEVAFDEGADSTVNQYYSVYSKTFPAGTFSLFQADNAGQNMYGVVVQPAPKPQLSVGIAFGRDDNGNGGALEVASVAGAVPQANWNNANGASGSAAAGTIVADAAGVATPTTISVEWSSPNTWASTGRGEENNGFPADSADRKLMVGYLDTNDGDGKAIVTVSGIPAEFTSGGYDVIVYGLGGVAGRGGAYTINGETKFGTSPASPAAHVEDAGAGLSDTGTYVRFRGQYGSSFTVTGSAKAADFPSGTINIRAPINAIQIVRNSDSNAGLVRGYLTKRRYDNIGSSVNIADLLSNPKYINDQADVNCLRTDFSANDADECDNCGIVVRGLFIPTASGPHTFYISADDGAALFLSTDETAANKVQIAVEPVWTGRRDYRGEAAGGGRGEPPINTSTPINLLAGVKYYIEGAVKEGGGGDNLDVAVQGPGDAEVQDGDRPIFGNRIATQVDLTGSSLAITTQPAALTRVPQGNTFAVSVASAATSPLCGAKALYQWQRKNNGGSSFTDIPGANSADFAISVVTLDDHLASFRCVVSFLGIQRISSEAALEVLGRECLKVTGAASSGFTTVGVTFSTFIATNEATVDAFNYTLRVTAGGAPGPQVQSVAVAGGNKGVILTLSEPLAENTGYTVQVGGITSLVGSELCAAPQNEASFTSWVTSAGGVVIEIYNVNNSNGIDDMISNQPTFPNSPRETAIISGFDSRLYYADDSHENYGGRMRGYFVPPISGNWVFHMRSDDPGRLFINPTGPSAAGKIQVGDQTGCCNGFPAGGAQLSSPYALEAGKAYYVELLWREFGGGDYGQVAVALQGAPGPTTPNLSGFLVGAGASPANVVGPVTITQQPASQSVFANSFVTLSVQASNPNGAPIGYQWTRNGTDIPGAVGPSYTFGPTTVADDNGAVFAVKLVVVGSSAVSDNATIEVKPDDVKPTVVSVTGSADLTKLTLVFSELVETVSAEDEFNYEIVSGAPGVTSAVLGGDRKTVTLIFDASFTPDTDYQLTVRGVKDLADNELNEIQLPFHTYAIRRGYVLKELYLNAGGGVLVSDLTANPKYPSLPDLVRYGGLAELNTFDEFEQYGARMSGWITAPVSGKYNFFMSSDDGGALYLSTDSTPANKVLVASEPVWNGRRDWLGTARRNVDAPENRSSTLFPDGIELTAGQSYYFEALVKEGGGGDNLAITWQLPGEALPDSGSAALSGVYISSLVDPTGAGISITQQPTDQSNIVIAGQTAVASEFTVAVSATGPNAANVFYQWERETPAGWRVVKGANSATFSIIPTLVDNGAKFRCEVFVPGAAAVSQTATLTVGQRNTPPTFTLNPPPENVNNDAGAQSIAGVATNIRTGSGAAIVPQVKITAPGDIVGVVSGENDGDGNAGAPPAAEGVEHVIDGVGQKYLNFLDLGSGFTVTPAFGSSIVTGIRLYTANDAEVRDPASYVLEGATSPDGPWTAISSGPLALPSGRNAGGSGALDPNTSFNQVVQFGNLTAYTSYRVTFPTLKDAAAANSMQIAEVELLGSSASQPDPEAGQIVHFNVSNDNPSLFAVQPAIDNNGRLTYTPAQGASGAAIVSVVAQDNGGTANGGNDSSPAQTFRLNIIGGNRCPVLAQIDQVILDEDTNSGNTNRVVGTDPDGNPLTYILVTPPAYGTLVLNATTGQFVYTPRANYYGPDSFWVVADDGTCRSEPLMVPLIICSVNDCPVLAEVPPIRVEEDTAANGQLFAFDPDDIREPVTYTVVTAPAHGTVTLNRSTGAFTYTPAQDYTGPDSFTVSATASLCDSSIKTVNITVIPSNDPPVLAPVPPINTATNTPASGRLVATDPENDAVTYSVLTQPSHGRVVVNPTTGEFTYTPDTGFTGTDSFTAVAADATGRSTPVVVTINIGNASNRCPVAVGEVGPTIELWLCGPGPHVIAGNFTDNCPNYVAYSYDSYQSHADVELDASGSTDADGDTLTYSWFVVQENGSTIPLATGQKPTVCLEVGTYKLRLVVDDGQCQDTTDIEFDVVSPGEAIQSVIDQVQDSYLRAKVRRPLISLLKSASACFDRGLCDSGVRQLAAFIQKVHAQLDVEYPELADDLIDTASEILDQIECPTPRP